MIVYLVTTTQRKGKRNTKKSNLSVFDFYLFIWLYHQLFSIGSSPLIVCFYFPLLVLITGSLSNIIYTMRYASIFTIYWWTVFGFWQHPSWPSSFPTCIIITTRRVSLAPVSFLIIAFSLSIRMYPSSDTTRPHYQCKCIIHLFSFLQTSSNFNPAMGGLSQVKL